MTTTGTMLQDDVPPARRAPRRPRRWVLIALAVVLALVVAVVVWAIEAAQAYYAIAPGTAPVVSAAADCKQSGGGSFALPGGRACVKVVLPAGKSSSVSGSVMMVDVLVGPASMGDFLLAKLGLLHQFRDGTVLVPKGEILGNTPASQLDCQGAQQMSDATSSAEVVALRRLGYHVGQNDLGAQVDLVAPGTPAAAAGVHCNDLVTAVDGHPVRTAADLVDAIHAAKPGATVSLTATRTGRGGKPATVHLQAKLSGTPAEAGRPAQPDQAFLGVSTQTRSTFSYPFPVHIQVGQIGGPSAGLAMTLGLLDALTNGQLTGGHRIAATGTIDLQGQVGPVGGVAQKAVAVRHAGAQVFLVPPSDLAAARSEARSMKVYPVTSLDQALNILGSLGGHVPKAPAASAAK
ncbi:MAG TPA: PDZ domain-containing protein [Acidimicrobiales bacterium]|nr:PDZ domain-containing protein [Acidimicrobiales bacterium]